MARLLQILTVGVFLAFLSSQAIPASTIVANNTDAEENRSFNIKRSFVEGPFGQVHLRIAKPQQPSSKRPLVLFHPTPYSSDYFKKFMDEMAVDRAVIAIDTPGYGDSDRPARLPTIADYAQSAGVVLTKLGIGRDGQQVDLLGYHTGTLIAAELAINNPGLIRKLVLPGMPYYTGEAREEAYRRNVKPNAIHTDGSHLRGKWDFASIAMPSGLLLTRAQEHFNDMMQCHPHCWEAYHAVFSYESEKRLKLVKQPVLLITTESSLKAETEAAALVFPDARLLHIAGVKYGGFDLATGKFAKATRDFLDNENPKN